MIGAHGIYTIQRRTVTPTGVQLTPVGRFAYIGNEIRILEDSDGVLASMLPEGEFTDRILQRLERMNRSAYWQVVLEEAPPQDV